MKARWRNPTHFIALRSMVCIRLRTVVALGSVSIVARCECVDKVRHVKAVEIVPPITYAEHGVQFQIEAWARDEEGRRTPYGGNVKWTLPDGVEYGTSDHRANPLTVYATVNAGSDVRRIEGILAKVGLRTSPSASVVVSRSAANTDQVVLDPAPPQPPSVAILDAGANGPEMDVGCVNDLTVAIARRAALDDDLTNACASEIAVFYPNQSVHYQIHDASESPWSTGHDELNVATEPLLVMVPMIHYWAADGVETAVDRAKDQLKNASRIFANNRAGVGFAPAPFEIQQQPPLTLASRDCGLASSALVDNGIDLSPRLLYVLYVVDIVSDASRGFACPPDEGRQAGIIVLNTTTMIDKTLAHEFGHMFALLEPFQGHTGSAAGTIAGFDFSNLMWAYDMPDERIYRIHASLGQVFRMNLDDRSWLVHASLRQASGKGVCQCNPYIEAPCPALARDVWGLRDSPPGTPSSSPGCT